MYFTLMPDDFTCQWRKLLGATAKELLNLPSLYCRVSLCVFYSIYHQMIFLTNEGKCLTYRVEFLKHGLALIQGLPFNIQALNSTLTSKIIWC